jgi:hypothetical protein
MKGQEMGVAEREDEIVSEQETEVTDDTEGQPEEGQDEGEEEAEESEGSESTEGANESEEEETVVTLGSEEPPASEEEKAAPKWVKELRQRQRELARENAELKAKLSTGQPAQHAKPQLPPKPKLSDPDIDYDEAKFDQKRDEWDAKKREIDAWEANQRAAAEEHQKSVQAVHENYAKSIKDLGVKDYQDLEEEVKAQFSQVQQSIVVAGAANPAAMVAALGRNPKKLAELASIKDPVKFAVAVGKLETEVKVTKRTSTKPAPEKTLNGTTSASSGSSKATLERLEAEAERTGDRSKVIAYKRSLKAQGK